jgi:hypothetical protein
MLLRLLRNFIFLILLLLAGMAQNANAQIITNKKAPTRSIRQDNRSTTERLAIKYYQNGEFNKAAEMFATLYNKKQTHYYYSHLFSSYVKLKEYDKAEKLAKKQNKKANSYRYKIDQAYIYDLKGLKKKSSNIINKLIKNIPETRTKVVQLASALQSRAYYEAALKVYEQANMNDEFSVNLELANAYQLTGQFDKMFDSYLNHLVNKPKDKQLIKNRIQSLLRFDVNDNYKQTLKQKLLLKTREFPDNLIFNELLLWYSMQTSDFEMAYLQATALDRRFGNGEGFLLELAEISFANKEFDVSAKTYKFLMENHKDGLFYNESYCGYFDAIFNKEISNNTFDKKVWNKLRRTANKALKEIGINAESASISRQLGYLVAFKLFEYDEAKVILENALAVPNIGIEEKNRIKLELADILVLQDQIWDASLLYSQIEIEMKHEIIGHEAKFRNAKLFYYVGEFQWSLTRLDILKSATSKLIANDAMELSLFINAILEEDTLGFTLRKFAAADLYSYRQQYDSALIFLDKIANTSNGETSLEYVNYQKAGIFEEINEYLTADSLYQQMWTNFPESIKSDNAIFKQAEINRTKLNNNEKAMELYLKLMKDHPDSIFAGEARLRFREIRENNNQQTSNKE